MFLHQHHNSSLKSTEAPCSYDKADFSHKLTTTIKILHQWPNTKVKPAVQIFLRDNKPRKGQQQNTRKVDKPGTNQESSVMNEKN